MTLRVKLETSTINYDCFNFAGGFPYPTTSNHDLPEMLRSGYRMEKPETCSQEV